MKSIAALILTIGLGAGALAQQRDAHDEWRLMQAAIHTDDAAAVARLIADGADLRYRGSAGITALHIAAVRSRADVVAALIEGGAEVDARDNDASTPLLDAAKHSARETNFPGRPSTRHPAESIRILLAAGADANARDSWGNTTLLGSGATAPPEVYALLLDAGADPDIAHDDGATPLGAALERNNLGALRLLLDAGADPDLYHTRGYANTVHYAIDHNLPEALALLLGAGAHANAPNDRGLTPLHTANRSAHGGSDLITTLLNAGADPNVADPRGRTALHTVRRAPFAMAMLEAGADLHIRANDGATALHHATLPGVASGFSAPGYHRLWFCFTNGEPKLHGTGNPTNLRLNGLSSRNFLQLIGGHRGDNRDMHRTIEHLTLSTGQTRSSPRSEVGDRTIASVRKLILKGWPPAKEPFVARIFPDDPKYVVIMRTRGDQHNVLVEIRAQDQHETDEAIISFGICWSEVHARKMWAELGELHGEPLTMPGQGHHGLPYTSTHPN